jgi:hypothetical protein
MLEQDRDIARSEVDHNVALKAPKGGTVRRAARGTAPPEPEQLAVVETDTVQCNKCKARVPFATAHVMHSHLTCTPCSLADMRAAAVAALPKNGENTKLPHQLGAPLVMLIMTVVLTAVLIAIFNL